MSRKSFPTVLLMLLLVLIAAPTVVAQQRRGTIVRPVPVTPAERARTRVPQIQVPDLSWMPVEQARAALDGANLLLGGMYGQRTLDAMVVKQTPEAGASVAASSPVYVTLGRPDLVLAASNSTPTANEQVRFTLSFQPPLPKALASLAQQPARTLDTTSMAVVRAPNYQFYWGDGSPADTGTADNATHAFPQPGEYLLHADAEVLGKKFGSNQLTIVAGFQQVALNPHSKSVDAGTPDDFTVETIPPAGPHSDVEYCFNWADDSPDTCGSSSFATHTYERPGQFAPAVMVSVNKSAKRASDAVAIQVKPVPRLTGATHLITGQDAVFRVDLRPQTTAKDQVSYCFRWQDNPQPDCGTSLQSRRFTAKGIYYVSVDVEVNGEKATAGPLPVHVDSYQATLSPAATQMETDKAGNFIAELKPPAPARSRVEYCFFWKDGTLDYCQAAETAVHAYSSRGTYRPYVEISVDGEKSALSEPLEIVVVLSWWRILLRVALVVGAFAAAYGVRRTIKMLRVRVTPHSGIAANTIADATSTSKGPLVRIRCVARPAAVTLTSPGAVVTRKQKEGTHVG